MNGNEIRKALSTEVNEIMELITRCVQVMQAAGSDQWNAEYPNREVISLDVERGTLYVYIDNDAIAGIIVLDENQAEQYRGITWSMEQGRHLIMHRLAVHPDVQGKGIARKLIAYSEKYARSAGYSSIRLDTYKKNTRALSLYPSLGYECRGEVSFPGRAAAFPVFEKVLESAE